MNMDEERRKIVYSKPMEKNPNWKGGKTYVYCECGKKIGYGHHIKIVINVDQEVKTITPFLGNNIRMKLKRN
jgi:uncharacterized protein (UPF0333 family)